MRRSMVSKGPPESGVRALRRTIRESTEVDVERFRQSRTIEHLTAHERSSPASLAIVVPWPLKAPLPSLNPHRRSGPCDDGGVLPAGAHSVRRVACADPGGRHAAPE